MPLIDLSHLNRFVQLKRFKMETSQPVLRAVRREDWMFSINLKDAYLQVPIHPDSCCYLWFVADSQVHHVKALCFGLSTAPQVFTRVMAPVSVILHDMGILILRYLDNWLVFASSRGEVLWARDKVLDLSSAWHRGEPCQVTSDSLLFFHLSGDISRELLFEGFSLAGEGFNPEVAARRISILQAAKCHCLEHSSGSSLLSVPSRSGGSSSDVLPSVGDVLVVGLSG